MTSVHSNHDIFAQGIEQNKKLKLTFFSSEHRRNLVSQCAPLHYSKGQTPADDRDCYYLWDFEAKKGGNFLALRPSQIVSMELTEDIFHVESLSSPSKTTEESPKGRDT